MKRIRAGIVLGAAAFTVACTDGGVVEPKGRDLRGAVGRPLATHVLPVVVNGNPTCDVFDPDGGGPATIIEIKRDPGTSGSVTVGAITVNFVVEADGKTWSFTSNVPAVGAISKGGDAANVYTYNPPVTSDAGLISPNNASGSPADLSHASVCVNEDWIVILGLQTSKTADTRFNRDWTWVIEKVGDQTSLALSPGQQFQVNYQVDVQGTSADSDWEVYGDILATNTNDTETIVINSITDLVATGVNGVVTCPVGVTFPHNLAAGATLTCSYVATLAALPNPASGINTATINATYGSVTTDFQPEDPWSFAAATITETDECIDVVDDQYGNLGQVCGTTSPKTSSFTYSLNIGPYQACGDYTFTNVASFTTNDTESTGSDDHTVNVNVPCGGCTLTQGYWKTHSLLGPAPYDDAWLAIGALGASTPFFTSGLTWYQVFWTAPQGRVWYILAHQYMAAKLNILNGASSTSDVNAAITWAETFFATYGPSSTIPGNVRTQALAKATILDGYNNGLTGPGHCSEQ